MTIARLCLTLSFASLFAASTLAQSLPSFEPTWFVGNSDAGEWLLFKQVYLTGGNYRFTGHLGATSDNASVQVVLRSSSRGDDIRLPATRVPIQETEDQFQLVHLGGTPVMTGYYDIYLGFLSKDVSADFIYLRKSNASSPTVLADDVASPAPQNNGTKVSPIGPYSTPSRRFQFLDYSEEQCLAWYRQSCHIGLDFEDGIRSAIETALSARLDWCWLHGRAAKFKEGWDWGVDREVVPNPGQLPGHRLKPYFEILDTIPHANHMRYSYFCDNVHFGKFFSKNHDGKEARWEDPEFQDFIWNNWIKAWYDHIPPERHMINENGRIFLYFWTADCGVKGKKMYEFLVDLKQRLKQEFDLEVDFILPGKFAQRDPRCVELTYAQPAWFYWPQKENLSFKEFNGKTLAFMTNGRRLPISSIWETDWDPKTGKGTRRSKDKNPDDGHLRSTHTNGKSDYEEGLKEANKRGAKWMVLESWGNTFEGSTWFRSDHPEYKFPNEFINITRKFNDTATSAIMLQAEAYDLAKDKTPGNAGKAFRYNWHTTGEPDVDIFRPLHRLEGFKKSEFNKSLRGIAAGTYDVWAVDGKGKPFANEIDGNEKWKPAKSNNLAFERLILGEKRGWCLSEGKLHIANLPSGWNYFNSGDWKPVKTPATMQELAAPNNSLDLWCIDTRGQLWKATRRKPKAGESIPTEEGYTFARLPSEKLRSIAVGADFIWALGNSGELLRRTMNEDARWKRFSTDTRFVHIAAGSRELWAMTRTGSVYRMPESGASRMEFVLDNVAGVSLGRGYVWLVKRDGSIWFSRMTGFASTKFDKSLQVKPE